MPLEHSHECGKLKGARVLRHVIDLELARAKADAFGHATGDDGHAQSGLLQEMHAEPVLDVVALEFVRRVPDGAEVDAAVGEHPIDVEPDEFDAARYLGGDYVRVARHTSSTLSRRAATSVNGSMFGPSLGAVSGFG